MNRTVATKTPPPEWYRLDNAAKIFPSVTGRRSTSVFRLSATLREEIDRGRLQHSLDRALERFPWFRVRLRRGLFWNYLSPHGGRPAIQEEREAPCRMFNRSDRGFLLRVLIHERRISLEFSHVLTDGTGALEFMRSLLVDYLDPGAFDIDPSLLDTRENPDPGEWTDSFRDHYRKKVPPPGRLSRAFHLKGKTLQPHRYPIITGVMPVSRVLEESRKRGLTLTEFMAALHIHALYLTQTNMPWKQRKRNMLPIRLMIPVNLRKLFPSRSMRNFFLAVTPGIDPRLGRFELEDIVKQVYHYMRVEIDERFIYRQISRNVQGETSPLVRIIPLVLKEPVQKILYSLLGSSAHSGVLSNLGQARLPEEIGSRVDRIEFIPNPNLPSGVNSGIISYGDNLYVTFGLLIENREVPTNFFREIRKLGIPVRIETSE
jgi:hypothetical protein